MTIPITSSTTKELQSYLEDLRWKMEQGRQHPEIALDLISHWEDEAIEVLDELQRRNIPEMEQS